MIFDIMYIYIYVYNTYFLGSSPPGERSHKDCCAKVAEPWLAQSHSDEESINKSLGFGFFDPVS